MTRDEHGVDVAASDPRQQHREVRRVRAVALVERELHPRFLQQFAKAWKAKYGYDPDYHAAAGVAAVEAFVNAIQAAGSTDPAKVRDALAKSSFDSLYGHIAFNDKGQISLPQIMIQIQNDKVVPIYAGNGFVNKLDYPLAPWNQH